jgi:hypothetical protein
MFGRLLSFLTLNAVDGTGNASSAAVMLAHNTLPRRPKKGKKLPSS